MRRRVLVASLLMAACGAVHADEWLAQAGRAWYMARLFHPRAAAAPEAWDAAFVEAIEARQADASAEGARRILARWTGRLDDPWTHVIDPSGAPPANAWSPEVVERDGASWVALGGVMGASPPQGQGPAMKALGARLASAEAVVIDLRPPQPRAARAYVPAFLVDRTGMLEPLLARAPRLPQVRTRYHSGLVTEVGRSSGGYESGFRSRDLDLAFKPAGEREPRLAFVVNRHVSVPVLAAALQREARAVIVSEDAAVEVLDNRLPTARFDIGDATLGMRLGELCWDID
jgi:hypothetical protein